MHQCTRAQQLVSPPRYYSEVQQRNIATWTLITNSGYHQTLKASDVYRPVTEAAAELSLPVPVASAEAPGVTGLTSGVTSRTGALVVGMVMGWNCAVLPKPKGTASVNIQIHLSAIDALARHIG